MKSLDRYKELKDLAEKNRDKANKAQGQLDGLMETLSQLGYGSVKEAKKALRVLAEEVAELEQRIETKIAAFEKQYKEHLDD